MEDAMKTGIEDTKYQVEFEKFVNFRENITHGRYKSLYIINHEKKYIWYVNPKCVNLGQFLTI